MDMQKGGIDQMWSFYGRYSHVWYPCIAYCSIIGRALLIGTIVDVTGDYLVLR